MTTSRRSFLAGLGSFLVAAPAIVRAQNLMPVKAILEFEELPFAYQYLHSQIALGYAITRQAIVQNLYGDFPFNTKVVETTAIDWSGLLRDTTIPSPLT